eukprot:12752218-Prorocentrum_lima.AAC.1
MASQAMEGPQDMEHRSMQGNQLEGLQFLVEQSKHVLGRACYGRTGKWAASPPKGLKRKLQK